MSSKSGKFTDSIIDWWNDISDNQKQYYINQSPELVRERGWGPNLTLREKGLLYDKYFIKNKDIVKQLGKYGNYKLSEEEAKWWYELTEEESLELVSKYNIELNFGILLGDRDPLGKIGTEEIGNMYAMEQAKLKSRGEIDIQSIQQIENAYRNLEDCPLKTYLYGWFGLEDYCVAIPKDIAADTLNLIYRLAEKRGFKYDLNSDYGFAKFKALVSSAK